MQGNETRSDFHDRRVAVAMGVRAEVGGMMAVLMAAAGLERMLPRPLCREMRRILERWGTEFEVRVKQGLGKIYILD